MDDWQKRFAAFADQICPPEHRDDFVQECWVGALEHGEGDGAVAAGLSKAARWLEREQRYESKRRGFEDIG